MEVLKSELDFYIKLALLEDSLYGDLTSEILEINANGEFLLLAKEDFILCGISIFERVFKFLDENIKFETYYKDGDLVKSGEIISRISGNVKSILRGERVALNFLQKLSGIATNTYNFVKLVEGTKVKILDTRKTTPLYRKLEKYAVKIGGGYNHRFSLFDGVLIKDNHIKVLGGIENAIKIAIKNKPFGKKIEVEISNIDELKIVLNYPIDIVMFDNFGIDMIKEAVKLIDKKLEIEVSGGVNINNVRDIALLGVDYISIGALTHSSRWVDVSLEFNQLF
ncbi:MAG: carboxylating nicotinate-nucleotide diphosphorylase [candidate division WOR-3 bacterium]|nr:carboxylating nicotinate-nucleotide diphosphorylase [candidate division WOR-3 bacterium]MDW8151060.1 carboxylating nicotinate-nucleotide diphosphorylase [candidate division WOR-3 bacterium]